jgi:hypothetical protein
MAQFIEQYCPICREDGPSLGKRDRGIAFQATCKECQATFLWEAKADTPVTVRTRLSERHQACGCNHCGR